MKKKKGKGGGILIRSKRWSKLRAKRHRQRKKDSYAVKEKERAFESELSGGFGKVALKKHR